MPNRIFINVAVIWIITLSSRPMWEKIGPQSGAFRVVPLGVEDSWETVLPVTTSVPEEVCGTPEPPLPFSIASCWPQSEQSCLVTDSWPVAWSEAHSKRKLTSTKTNVTSDKQAHMETMAHRAFSWTSQDLCSQEQGDSTGRRQRSERLQCIWLHISSVSFDLHFGSGSLVENLQGHLGNVFYIK